MRCRQTPTSRCGTAPRPSPRPSPRRPTGFSLDLAEPALGVARGQFAVLYDDDAVVGAGVDHGRRLNRASRIAAREPCSRRPPATSSTTPWRRSSSRAGPGSSTCSSAWEARSAGSRRSSRAPSATLLPVIVKAGGTVDRVNDQLDKLDTVTDSAVSMADSADTAVRAVSTAITTPVKKVSGFASRPVARRVRVPVATRCGRGGPCRQGRGCPARERARRRASQCRHRRSRRARLRRRSRVRPPATPLVESRDAHDRRAA